MRFIREVNESVVEVMDVDVNFETGENFVFEVPKSSLRPMQVMDDALGDDDDVDEEEGDFLDEKVLTLCDSCWALVELSLQDSDVIAAIVGSGLCPRLVELLYLSQSSIILAPVLRLLGNIVSAEVSFSQQVIEANLLSVIPSVMTNTSRAVREEACWMLSNIAGGQAEQVQIMMQTPGVLSGLVEQMAWAEYGVKREATWAVCNMIVQANAQILAEMVRIGVLQCFCPMLEEWEDPMVELVILEAIESLLNKYPDEGRISVEESGCLSKIEELCYDDNSDVSNMASQLIDTWFSNDADDEATDASIAPAVVTDSASGAAPTFAFQPAQGETQVFNFTAS